MFTKCKAYLLHLILLNIKPMAQILILCSFMLCCGFNFKPRFVKRNIFTLIYIKLKFDRRWFVLCSNFKLL